MQNIRKFSAVAVAATATVALAAGCGGSSGGSGGSGGGGGVKAGQPVTLTWWHNGTSDPFLTDWKQAADDYHKANPNVSFKVVPIQNEQFTTKMPLALQSSTPPDIYFNQGGGLLATQSQSGRVADITDQTSDWLKQFGAVAEGWQVEGKQLGVPTDAHVVGFWYRKDLFAKAGQDVLDFIASKPFQEGFNGTPAQQGAGSSAGMVVNGKAAMELQGDWDPSVMAALTSNKNFRSTLGWFPFPPINGAAGDPSAALGGGDGFACTTKNADACVAFLKYLSGPEIQQKLVTSGAVTIPVNPAAQSAIKDPTIKQVFDYNSKASYVQVYFDIALPTAAGQALDDAAADLFAGKGGADSVAKAVNAAG